MMPKLGLNMNFLVHDIEYVVLNVSSIILNVLRYLPNLMLEQTDVFPAGREYLS